MKGYLYILLLLLGFALAPTSKSVACGASHTPTTTDSTATHCEKEKPTKIADKSCTTHNHPNGADCADACKGKPCQCRNLCVSPAVPTPVLLFTWLSSPLIPSKQQALHEVADLTAGFHTVWLPPKIG